jgi:Na+/proline symporter
MQIALVDGLIILAYFLFTLIVGLWFSRRAGKSIDEYFISGHQLPWWLAGTSMVATTFAADTPLAVTGLVANHGIAGNWLWWNMVFSGMLTVFLFARLWRRAEVLTDVEFTEIRYSGKPAAFLRGFRALYLALPINCAIMGWVTLAMVKIMNVTLGLEKWTAVLICVGVTLAYSVLSGLWGVAVTDFFQFFLALIGSIALAIFAVNAAGGMSALKEKVILASGGDTQVLSFLPDIGSPWMPVSLFVAYLAVNWWAAWYPGAEPGGGGYIAQRMFSAKNEKHALLSTLWFNIAHYCLRPWPWILVALASIVFYPQLADKESGYVQVLVDYLPAGFRGLMLAAFAAAYMSTISTQLNWGSSYLVNDFYRRFIRRAASNEHYVMVSRLVTLVILAFGALATWAIDTVAQAWKIILAMGAGTGAVYILRWYWWRINAWSEIAAMSASLILSLTLPRLFGWTSDRQEDFAALMLSTVAISTLVWLTATFLTRPEPQAILERFYRKVRPAGPGWPANRIGGIEAADDGAPTNAGLGVDLSAFLLGAILIYALLFGIGKMIFGEWIAGGIGVGIALLCLGGIGQLLSRRGWLRL